MEPMFLVQKISCPRLSLHSQPPKTIGPQHQWHPIAESSHLSWTNRRAPILHSHGSRPRTKMEKKQNLCSWRELGSRWLWVRRPKDPTGQFKRPQIWRTSTSSQPLNTCCWLLWLFYTPIFGSQIARVSAVMCAAAKTWCLAGPSKRS